MSIAVLGYGVVGKGCVYALKNTNIKIARVLDARSNPEIDLIRTENINDILNDGNIELVAEMLGGEHPAYEYVKSALLVKKHVVTSNKLMLSLHYKELTRIAEDNGVRLLFSACVGGEIPWIRNLKRTASIDEVTKIGGVMNGTSNFILNMLMDSDLSFEEALAKAQELGYAEKDPTADIMGYDVRAKLAISCNVAFRTNIVPDDIPTKGINDISKETIQTAKEKGAAIRLLAHAEKTSDGRIVASVEPSLVYPGHPAYFLPDAENIFFLTGKRSGKISFSGMGAGGAPTGMNVAEDIMEALAE